MKGLLYPSLRADNSPHNGEDLIRKLSRLSSSLNPPVSECHGPYWLVYLTCSAVPAISVYLIFWPRARVPAIDFRETVSRETAFLDVTFRMNRSGGDRRHFCCFTMLILKFREKYFQLSPLPLGYCWKYRTGGITGREVFIEKLFKRVFFLKRDIIGIALTEVFDTRNIWKIGQKLC